MADAEHRVRSLGQFRLVAVMGALSTLALLLMAAGTGSDSARLFAVLAALAFAALTIRGVRAGVYLEGGEVRIRGMLMTRRVELAAIESFGYEPLRRMPAVGVARMRDGRRLAITAIGAGHVPNARAAGESRALVAELNDLLRAGRGEIHISVPLRDGTVQAPTRR